MCGVSPCMLHADNLSSLNSIDFLGLDILAFSTRMETLLCCRARLALQHDVFVQCHKRFMN